jgi:hypothetical protein
LITLPGSQRAYILLNRLVMVISVAAPFFAAIS